MKLSKFFFNNFKNICLPWILNLCGNISSNDLIIEPSAGNGSFIKCIKEISNNYKFYDLQPENNEINKQDFLILDTKKYISFTEHIISSNKKINVFSDFTAKKRWIEHTDITLQEKITEEKKNILKKLEEKKLLLEKKELTNRLSKIDIKIEDIN